MRRAEVAVPSGHDEASEARMTGDQVVLDGLTTERLRLRRWRDDDRGPFAALNSDPAVMEWLPAPLTREESDQFLDRIEASFEREGYGLWAVEVRATGSFAGYVGLWQAVFEASFTPAVEVGWRLVHDCWGRGYATEAATASVHDGFERLGLDEIVSFTATSNVRSQAVMRRIGMTTDPADDFDHPRLAEGHRLRHHVLYRLRSPSPAGAGRGSRA